MHTCAIRAHAFVRFTTVRSTGYAYAKPVSKPPQLLIILPVCTLHLIAPVFSPLSLHLSIHLALHLSLPLALHLSLHLSLPLSPHPSPHPSLHLAPQPKKSPKNFTDIAGDGSRWADLFAWLNSPALSATPVYETMKSIVSFNLDRGVVNMPIERQGYLEKLAMKSKRNWKSRYFVLQVWYGTVL